MTILVTGGAGFIGSHLIWRLVKSCPDYTIINLDALTYTADMSRLDDINSVPNYMVTVNPDGLCYCNFFNYVFYFSKVNL
ncbi:MAG: GDP-mannose 4,6-dehydratase [Flavobacteriaceae bacterium]|nr:GDP-mannose 4,6-dehydratase [Flavobacteriaceae bacterium]